MDLDELEGDDLEDIAKKIQNMEIRGAAKIARAGALALKRLVENYDGDDVEDLESELEKGAKRLRSTRPTAVSLENAINYVMTVESEGVEGLKKEIVNRASRFIEKSLEAKDKIAEYGGKRITDGDVILTHCNSSMAIGAIKYSWDEGKNIEVIATESRPKRQGYITIKELSEYGIPVTLIVDSAVRYKMRGVDKVYVGADTVASNGAVINKIGTSQVALCAHESRVPLTVCAETYKFSNKTTFGELVEIEERDPSEIVDPADFPEVNINNPVFDATPSKYVDSIITEKGVISPDGAYRIIKEMEE
ncbi:MAG: ribose 1,5-bisphosphate isomerase [Candidatus Thermoplasmatota archaeon]|nr:ribose 1,5-bisphosphate isomerase [Candidatus Thermoplasmatota archaeon]MBS3789313.1 ribose 1,5-bisphosphate isomerase [Candidatus Thermoplasmatota archaeon]